MIKKVRITVIRKVSHADLSARYENPMEHACDMQGAVNILFGKEIEKAKDPEARRKELQTEYREKFANPYRAAELGYVDEVIDPAITRLRLIRSFEMLANKRQSNPPKKHSNLPL